MVGADDLGLFQDVALHGKRVAIVGTGSTAAQLAPAIASDVEQLHIFQRQPGWLQPKLEPQEARE